MNPPCSQQIENSLKKHVNGAPINYISNNWRLDTKIKNLARILQNNIHWSYLTPLHICWTKNKLVDHLANIGLERQGEGINIDWLSIEALDLGQDCTNFGTEDLFSQISGLYMEATFPQLSKLMRGHLMWCTENWHDFLSTWHDAWLEERVYLSMEI